MNKDQFEGAWHKFKGKVKHTWGELTDDDLDKINGKTEELSGILQKKYGYNKEQANKKIEAFLNGLDKNK